MNHMLLKNFKTVAGQVVHLQVADGKIKKIDCPENVKDDVIIDGGLHKYISEGWVDIHTHCFDKWELYGDRIDIVGYQSGVCTVVDAGTCGSDDFAEFVEQAREAKTKAFGLLNVSRMGIVRQDELADMTLIDKTQIAKTLQRYKDYILGLKVRMSRSVVKENGDAPLFKAVDLANDFNLPLMVHIGNPPSYIETVMKALRPKDIVTHIFNPKENGVLDAHGKIKPEVWDAHLRGVVFDLGHGTDSFGYQTAQQALAEGLKCDTISTDIYFHNRLHGPVYSMGDVLSKMLYVGYSLAEVIEAVTTKPRLYLPLPKAPLDLTIFEVKEEELSLPDSTKATRTLRQRIVPCAVMINGNYKDLKEDTEWISTTNMTSKESSMPQEK